MVGKWKRWSEPLDSTEHPLHAWPLHHTIWPNVRNPPKIKIKKFVKLTVHSYACNSLTDFECVANATTRNGKCCKSTKVGLEKTLENVRQNNLFLAGFRRLEPMCISLRPETTAAAFAAIYRMMSRSLASVTDKSWNLKQPQRIQCRQINTNQV